MPKLAPEFDRIAAKVRKISKIFINSPVRNDAFLQPEIFKFFGKEKSLLLDCRMRWNSHAKLLKRCYELRKEVRTAMILFPRAFNLTDDYLESIKELCAAIEPIEMAVQYLCKKSTDLFLAGKVIELTVKKLCERTSEIGSKICEKFVQRKFFGSFFITLRTNVCGS